MYISREHLALDYLGDNRFTLIDRNSACGTMVEDARVGGRDSGGAIDLKSGQTIRIGSCTSPYLFRFDVDEYIDEV
jgi:pSer/pThr/pTyr-binding forkhead associated (FHA) protein